jgi:hypothetical protein
MMVGDNNRRGSKRSLSCSGSNEIATSTYHSVLVDDVNACYSMMVGDNNRRGSKRSLSCSGSNEIATSTYHSVLVDDVTDTAAAFATTVSARNKQIRLELTGIS